MLIELPLAEMQICWPLLVSLGLVIGILAGFFGVGGGFLITPMLNVLFGIPYNIAVGSSLSQMVGLSSSAAMQHGRMGNIDYQLGVMVLVGATGGAELGARVLEALEQMGTLTVHGTEMAVIELVMSILYILLLAGVGVSITREALANGNGGEDDADTDDENEPDNVVMEYIHDVEQPPQIRLKRSGIGSICVWIPIAAGLMVGFLSGMLGVGGGFILMPTLIYVIGAPTIVAVGTDLFQIIFTAAYGTYTHSMKGNVDFVLVVLLLVGSVVGAQIGASLTNRFDPDKVRGGFAVLTFMGLFVVAGKLLMRIFG